MRIRKMFYAFALMLILGGVQLVSRAQEADSSSKTATPPIQKDVFAYHFDFSISELENGKKLNTRKYSMNLTTAEGGGKDLKIGTRVPVQSEDGKFQYLDVGTNISARLVPYRSPLSLDVNVEISSFASPEEATHGGHPLLRQIRIGASTPVIVGKSIIIGSVDDPNSTREFQLEVTATKL